MGTIRNVSVEAVGSWILVRPGASPHHPGTVMSIGPGASDALAGKVGVGDVVYLQEHKYWTTRPFQQRGNASSCEDVLVVTPADVVGIERVETVEFGT